MVNRPEDRNKVFALGASIVVTILYFLFGVLPRLLHGTPGVTSPGPSDSQTNTQTPPPASITTAEPGAPLSTPIAQLAGNVGNPPVVTSDPFKPPYSTVVPNRNGTAPNRTPGGPLPGPGASPTIGIANNTTGFKPLPLPMPIVELQGIILGDPSVAVLRVGDQTLYKHEGEKLQAGILLKRISENGIELIERGKRVQVEVGHATAPEGGPAPTNTGAVLGDMVVRPSELAAIGAPGLPAMPLVAPPPTTANAPIVDVKPIHEVALPPVHYTTVKRTAIHRRHRRHTLRYRRHRVRYHYRHRRHHHLRRRTH